MKSSEIKVDSLFMELSLINHFNQRHNLIIPNIYWGIQSLRDYEKDLIVVRPSGYVLEVEIKISKADLKADKKKTHGHYDPMIKELWFAYPDYMDTEECLAMVPERAGVIIVTPYKYSNSFGRCTVKRKAKINTTARPLPEKDQRKIGALATMRMWDLKQKVNSLNSDIKRLREQLNEKLQYRNSVTTQIKEVRV